MRMPDGYINILHPDGKGTEVRVEQKELVMCKHCKSFSHGYCRFHDAKFVRPDGYCYWGERKDGDHHEG